MRSEGRRGFLRTCAGLAMLAAAGCGAGPAQPIERLDVTVTVRPEGALDVHEEIAIRVADAGAGFERVVESARADALHFAGAAIDGRALEDGDGLAVSQGRRLRVRWDLPAAPEVAHLLVLDYRVEAAIALEGGIGRLRWAALPAGRTGEIGTGRLELRLPGLTPIEGTLGIAESGWTVARTEDGITAERAPIGTEETAVLVAEFGADPAQAAEPDWQFNAARRAEFVPAFVAGGLFILTIGAGILWIVRFQHPRRKGPLHGRSVGGDTPPADAERAAAAAGLRTGGVVTIVFGLAVGAIALLFTESFGRALLAIPLSILIVGIALITASRRL